MTELSKYIQRRCRQKKSRTTSHPICRQCTFHSGRNSTLVSRDEGSMSSEQRASAASPSFPSNKSLRYEILIHCRCYFHLSASIKLYLANGDYYVSLFCIKICQFKQKRFYFSFLNIPFISIYADINLKVTFFFLIYINYIYIYKRYCFKLFICIYIYICVKRF